MAVLSISNAVEVLTSVVKDPGTTVKVVGVNKLDSNRRSVFANCVVLVIRTLLVILFCVRLPDFETVAVTEECNVRTNCWDVLVFSLLFAVDFRIPLILVAAEVEVLSEGGEIAVLCKRPVLDSETFCPPATSVVFLGNALAVEKKCI